MALCLKIVGRTRGRGEQMIKACLYSMRMRNCSSRVVEDRVGSQWMHSLAVGDPTIDVRLGSHPTLGKEGQGDIGKA